MGFARELREQYFDEGESLDDLCENYLNWVSKPEFLTFCKESEDFSPNEYVCIKKLKRGNDIYCSRVRKRFSNLYDLCELNKDIAFLKEDKQRYGFSNFLFITLTFDTKLKPFNLAWIDIGKDLNLFLSKLKQCYGDFVLLRCFEAYGNGYPHIHMLILFREKVFHAKRHLYYNKKRKPKIKYIIDNKNRGLISDFWHSNVDINAVKSLGAVKYLLKYVTKDMYRSLKGLTSVCMLLFNKRSYSISKDFVLVLGGFVDKIVTRLDTTPHNSNINLKEFVYVGCFVPPFNVDKWFFAFSGEHFNVFFKIFRENNINVPIS